MKREGYISWDEYFFGIAKLSALRSKDPATQVGACIINDDKKIVGIGYNGFPTGIDDDSFSWDRHNDDELQTKYPYVCHAELNAILNSTLSIKGATIYVTLFPCNECSKAIIQSGIKKVCYLEDRGFEVNYEIASKNLLMSAGVEVIKCEMNKEINL